MRSLIARWRIGILCGMLAAAVVAVPITLFTQVTTSSSTQTQDEIIYNQKKSSTYLQYSPVSGTGATQNLVSGGGGCSNPSFGSSQVMSISGAYYPTGYGNSPTAATAGLYNLRTGVGCDGAPSDQAWSIQPNEALTFAMGSGTGSPVAGRLFASADITLENEGKTNVSGQFVPYLKGTALAPIPFAVTTSTPDLVAHTGTVSGGFDRLDVQVNSGVVSVVGPLTSPALPAPIFYLENQICGGQKITAISDGTVSATITANANNTCKTYSNFSSGTDANGPVINFSSSGGSNSNVYTAHFDWGYVEPPCAPDTANPCPTVTVSFDGINYSDETPCTSAPASNGAAWCVTNSQFQQTTNPADNKPATHMTEDWAGSGDPTFR